MYSAGCFLIASLLHEIVLRLNVFSLCSLKIDKNVEGLPTNFHFFNICTIVACAALF